MLCIASGLPKRLTLMSCDRVHHVYLYSCFCCCMILCMCLNMSAHAPFVASRQCISGSHINIKLAFVANQALMSDLPVAV